MASADTTWLGIDPGSSGGIAAIRPDGSLFFASMPETEWEVWLLLSGFNRGGGQPVQAVIELVSGYIGEAQPGSAAFKFGQSYGALRMALTAAGISFTAVTPQRWQGALGVTIRKGVESKRQRKERMRGMAERLYPNVKLTLATSDAVLLAHYAKHHLIEEDLK